jgi:hypothetical protein
MFGFLSSLFGHTPVSQTDIDPLEGSCCICYHTYNTGSEAEAPVQLTCGHIFGNTCMNIWRETSSTCPLCRANLDFADNDIYEEDSATSTHRFVEQFSHAEDFSWQSDAFSDYDSDSDFDSRSEAEDEDIWFDAHAEVSASDPPLTSLPSISPGHVIFNLSEDIWITARHEEQVSEASPSIPFNDLFEDDKALDLDYSDSFDDLQELHEQSMTEVLEDEDSDDEDAIGYFDVFPH